MDPELKASLKKLLTLTSLVMVLLAIYLTFNYVLPLFGRVASYFPVVLMPFILALVIAIVVEPVVIFFETRGGLHRNLAVVLSLVMVMGGFVAFLAMISLVLIKETTELYKLAVARSDDVINQVLIWVDQYRVSFLQLNLPPQVESAVGLNLQKAVELIQKLMDGFINALVQGFVTLPNILIFIGIATVATYLIIKDRALIRTFVIRIMPSSVRADGTNIVNELFKALSGFVKAYSILITITAVLTLVSLKILGVEYALLIGLLVGIADVLPILGPGLIFLPWVIWEFIKGNIGMGISLLIVYIIITAVRQFLEPQIVGDSIGLHPLVTLIALYVGLRLGGIYGMILGPVLVVIFIACYRAGLFERFDWREKDE
ncbi:MAG: sporulation integral membrane protein YtvI [Syntrophomonadaceae bacterium]|nr:sporulation integral membrane protein YtvI [Syntrophomonadaceae bacterium]